MRLKKLLAIAALLVSSHQSTQAAFSIVASEQGSTVVFHITGSTNLDPMFTTAPLTTGVGLSPSSGYVVGINSNPDPYDLWLVSTGTNWGPGNLSTGSLTGHGVTFQNGGLFGIPADLASADTYITFNGSFASLGLTQGNYSYTFSGAGAATDTITLSIGVVPEPSIAVLSAIGALALMRRRR